MGIRVAIAAVCGIALQAILPAQAEDWPSRPVRIVSTFAAGGSADVLARIVAEHLTTALGQQFFVETRAGAAGAIGVQAVVNSPPDGYNFVITNVTLLALLPSGGSRAGYDPHKDLTNIAYIAGSPIVFSVNAKSGIKTLADFIAAGKNPSKPLTYSSSGVGSMGHLFTEAFAEKTGIAVEHVPYKGASQGITDLVGGHITFSSQILSSTASQIKGGTLGAVAHAATERLPDYPDVPTFKELGYDEFVSTTWFSLSGPAGLPKEMVDKVNREIVRGMALPETQKRLREDGMVTTPMTSAEFNAFVERETKRWKPLVDKVGAKVN
jgi:tripartite-type tricarboxylate transporter receptor subunit TctC